MTRHYTHREIVLNKLAKRGRELTQLISGKQHDEWVLERRQVITKLIEEYNLSVRATATMIGLSSSRVDQEYKKGK